MKQIDCRFEELVSARFKNSGAVQDAAPNPDTTDKDEGKPEESPDETDETETGDAKDEETEEGDEADAGDAEPADANEETEPDAGDTAPDGEDGETGEEDGADAGDTDTDTGDTDGEDGEEEAQLIDVENISTFKPFDTTKFATPKLLMLAILDRLEELRLFTETVQDKILRSQMLAAEESNSVLYEIEFIKTSIADFTKLLDPTKVGDPEHHKTCVDFLSHVTARLLLMLKTISQLIARNKMRKKRNNTRKSGPRQRPVGLA